MVFWSIVEKDQRLFTFFVHSFNHIKSFWTKVERCCTTLLVCRETPETVLLCFAHAQLIADVCGLNIIFTLSLILHSQSGTCGSEIEALCAGSSRPLIMIHLVYKQVTEWPGNAAMSVYTFLHLRNDYQCLIR